MAKREIERGRQLGDQGYLSKKEQDDVTIGLPNRVNLLCPSSYLLIAPKGTCIKIQKNVSVSLQLEFLFICRSVSSSTQSMHMNTSTSTGKSPISQTFTIFKFIPSGVTSSICAALKISQT
jgi:hypothetical protein